MKFIAISGFTCFASAVAAFIATKWRLRLAVDN